MSTSAADAKFPAAWKTKQHHLSFDDKANPQASSIFNFSLITVKARLLLSNTQDWMILQQPGLYSVTVLSYFQCKVFKAAIIDAFLITQSNEAVKTEVASSDEPTDSY